MSYIGIFTFLVESYPLYAASAMAANSFARYVNLVTSRERGYPSSTSETNRPQEVHLQPAFHFSLVSLKQLHHFTRH